MSRLCCLVAWGLLAVPAPGAGQGGAAAPVPAQARQTMSVRLPPAGPVHDAWRALETGSLEAAAEAFERARSAEPQNPLVHLGLGLIARRLGRSAEAEDALARAVGLAPDLSAASLVLGEVRYERGNLDGAISAYEEALARAPGEARLAARLAQWRKEASLHGTFLQAYGSHFTVLFEGPAEEDLARRAVDVLESAYDRIGASLLTFPLEPVTVVLYTRDQFRDITRSPQWSGGVFDGRIRVPVSGALKDVREFERVLVHEYVHAVVYSVVTRGVPTWLNEGLAGYFEPGGAARAAGRARAAGGRWLPLSGLAGSFASLPGADVELAYAISALAVRAMIDRMDGLAVVAILNDLAAGVAFEEAFSSRIQMPFAEFERDLRAQSARQPGRPRPGGRFAYGLPSAVYYSTDMAKPSPGVAEPQPLLPEPIAVIDIGASAVRLMIAEVRPGTGPVVTEEASRAVLLGKDTFSSGGTIGPQTLEATLRALEGFRRLMDEHGVRRYRAVATSAVRESANADTFIDRVQIRTGLQVEIIDGSEESRLTYLAVRDRMADHPALASRALLVEAGAGSADITLLEGKQPKYSGVYALGSIRMRQALGRWKTDPDRRGRALARYVSNIISEISREMPLMSATHMIALGQDARFAARQIVDTPDEALREVPRDAFLSFCDRIQRLDEEELVDRYRLSLVDAETLGPALMVYRGLLAETAAPALIVPDTSLRVGLLVDLVGGAADLSDFSRQVLASAESLGEKYRYDAEHARAVSGLAVRLFDELQAEHGMGRRDRLLLEVAALLHDIGVYIGLRAHHKHTQYLLSASEIFGLSADDRAIIANIARYHRRALPQRSHLPYVALDRPERVRVNKLAAILRLANALDVEHLRRVSNVRVFEEQEGFVLELGGDGDLSTERMAVLARSDLFVDVFGRKLMVRVAGA